MKRLNWVILPLLIACGVGEVEREGAAFNEFASDLAPEVTSKAITLQPQIRPEGIDALYARLSVTDQSSAPCTSFRLKRRHCSVVSRVHSNFPSLMVSRKRQPWGGHCLYLVQGATMF